MVASQGQRFANEILPRALFADPLAFTRAIAGGEVSRVLAELWDQAADPAAAARIDGAGLAATLERRGHGHYVTSIVTPPPPRASGDPALIAIVGRGDGADKLSTVAYYVLELELDAEGAPSFRVVSRTDRARLAVWTDAPLPDPRWLTDYVFELYCGRIPTPSSGIPELPGWYWWYAFDGPAALRSLGTVKDEAACLDAVRAAPILLVPEIADAAESYESSAVAGRVRDLQRRLRMAPSWVWQALVQRLASNKLGSAPANNARAIALIAEARQRGALANAQAYGLEGTLRTNLAALGIDSGANRALAEELFAAARAAPDELDANLARGSAPPPPIPTEDPLWRPLFLDSSDLPNHVPAEHDDALSASEPAFAALGGMRAGFAAWTAHMSSPMVRVVDSRWVFRTARAADNFMRSGESFSDGLPRQQAPQFGDETLAFGEDGITGGIRAYVLAIRIGRVVARLRATEGGYAAASRQVLHSAMLHPLAARIVQRARQGLAAYWLAVAYPTNAVAALVHTPGHNVAQLLPAYPLLAHPELPSAVATLGDSYLPAARALASYQVQMRANRWQAYRQAMLALVRTLLATDMGDPLVNAAHAHEIVTELRFLDPDPVWLQLDEECRARG